MIHAMAKERVVKRFIEGLVTSGAKSYQRNRIYF